MKKILGILASAGLVATTITPTVGCGTKVVKKTNLKEVVKETKISGDCYNTETVVLLRILELNSNLQKADIKLEKFHPATYKTDGSAKILARSQSKFFGEVVITIRHLTPTPLIHFLWPKLDLGLVKNGQEAQEKAEKIINEIPELKDRVILSAPFLIDSKKGKIHVRPKDYADNLTGEEDFLYVLQN